MIASKHHHRMPADTDAHDFGGNVIGSADCCCVVRVAVLVAALSCSEIKTIPHAAPF